MESTHDSIAPRSRLWHCHKSQISLRSHKEVKKEGHMKRHVCRQMMGSVGSIMVLLSVSVAWAQTNSQSKALELVCFTERPAVDEGENTRLQAWATTPDGQEITQPVSFTWHVTDGAVRGDGSEVEWNLSGVPIASDELPKKATATVKAMAPGVGQVTCVVEVSIGKKEQDGSKASGAKIRDGLRSAYRYLLPNESEELGFGLYSYLLFPAPPGSDGEKARYLKTLESCLRVMESVEEHMKQHRETSELNATHIPVKMMPKQSKVLTEGATNVLEVYDYVAAQKLLDKLRGSYQRGPYLISVLQQPLSVRTTPAPAYLLHDFTGTVPELVSQLVSFFTYRAAQQRTWSDESLMSFRLSVRNLIAVAAKVAPDIANEIIRLVPAKQDR